MHVIVEITMVRRTFKQTKYMEAITEQKVNIIAFLV